MDDFDQLIKRSQLRPEPVTAYKAHMRQRIARAVEVTLRRIQLVLALLAVVAGIFMMLALSQALAEVWTVMARYQLATQLPTFMSLLSIVAPWASLLCFFLIAALLALVHRRQRFMVQIIKKGKPMKLLNVTIKRRWVLPGLILAATGLTATSALAYYQVSSPDAHRQAQLERRAQNQKENQKSYQQNERDIPKPSSGVQLPDCAKTNEEPCIYRFGETKGGDAVVVPAAYFADDTKIRAFGQKLFEQTKDGNTGKLPIYSSRADAQGLSKDAGSHASGEFACAKASGCDMSYWPHGYMTNATSDERVHIVYRAYPPMPSVDPNAVAWQQKLVSKRITMPLPSGQVVSVNPDGYTLVTVNPAQRLVVKVSAKTDFISGQGYDTHRSAVKVGDVVTVIGTYESDAKSSVVARLVVDDTGYMDGQAVVVDTMPPNQTIRRYLDELLAE